MQVRCLSGSCVGLAMAWLVMTYSASAQQPPSAPKRLSDGQKMIFDYFKLQVKQSSDNCLSHLTTREAWEAHRPELRRQFLEMMGLWPLPERTPLQATITGTVEGQGYIVEKLHFQSRPGLYVTANFYRPKKPPAPKLPTILYVCGHGNVVENGISYGSKVRYQYHPAWFANHGYNCLILDTLQLGEIEGIHHGTYRFNMWWWQSRGYTPAGVELWNGLRALDYLESRPDVDMSKIGLTGRSGGGATSWWIAAADDRVKAVAPIAGIADLLAYVVEGEADRFKTGVIDGHCDCMFFVNKYRWDFAQVAALIAPRPLLLGNSDKDDIFPVGGYRRLAAKVSKVYELYHAPEAFQLLETKGPHEDTPELRIGINRFMNRYLRGDTTTKVEDDLPPKLRPEQLKVFTETPLDSVNEHVHEVFTAEHSLKLPDSEREIRSWWAVKQSELKKRLEREVFAGWPKSPPPLDVKVVHEAPINQRRYTALEYTSEAGLRLRLYLTQPEPLATLKAVIFRVENQREWDQLRSKLAPEVAKVYGLDIDSPAQPGKGPSAATEPSAAYFGPSRSSEPLESRVNVLILPRGIGPTQWAEPGSRLDVQMQRRFALIGQTLAGQQIWDIRRAMAATREYLKLRSDGSQREYLESSDDSSSVLALYAALFEPRLAAVDLVRLPTSTRTSPALLGVSRVLDNPFAVALVASQTKLNLSQVHAQDWSIPVAIQQAFGWRNFEIK